MVSQEGLGLEVGRCVNDRVMGSWDPEWLQGALNMVMSLLCWYGLGENIAKSKSITYQPGTIQSGMSEEAVGQWCTGRGATYHDQMRRQKKVELNVGLMIAHRRRMHGTYPEID